MGRTAKEGRRTLGAVKLKKWREQAGMTQAEAARQAGVSAPAWSDWEAFMKKPDLRNASALELLTEGSVAIADWLANYQAQEPVP